MKSFCGILCALSGTICAAGWCVDAPAAAADYELVSRYELGAPNFWDYLTYDPHQHRLYAAHINKVDVIDTLTGKPVGPTGNSTVVKGRTGWPTTRPPNGSQWLRQQSDGRGRCERRPESGATADRSHE